MCFWSRAVLPLLNAFLLPSLLTLVAAIQRISLDDRSVLECNHSAVKPLWLYSWEHVLIVDFGIDTFTSLRVLLTLLDVVKVYLFVCYFFNQRIKYAIINFNFLPWSFRPFGVAKLAIGFLFLRVSVLLMWQQVIKSRSFMCSMYSRGEGLTWVNCPVAFESLKTENYVYKWLWFRKSECNTFVKPCELKLRWCISITCLLFDLKSTGCVQSQKKVIQILKVVHIIIKIQMST